MRRRRRWVGNLAVPGVAILIGIIALPAAIYVYENTSPWEPLAIFVCLGLGLGLAVWYFRTKRYGWLAGILSGVLLVSSFASALAHGWEAQATALIAFSGLTVTVVGFVSLRRSKRNVEAAIESEMRELGEELREHGHFFGDVLFRDDGERITVYPNRRRLLLSCAVLVLFLAVTVIGGAFIFISTGNIFVLIALLLCAGMLVPVLLFSLYRLLIRRPTLVVGPDGILDHGSLIATGMGLLRWDEILGVTENTMSSNSGRVINRYLGILVTDARAIRKRQPVWKQFALPLLARSWPSEVNIWQGMLDRPTNELKALIRRYVDTHAPPGWLPKVDDEDSVLSDREHG